MMSLPESEQFCDDNERSDSKSTLFNKAGCVHSFRTSVKSNNGLFLSVKPPIDETEVEARLETSLYISHCNSVGRQNKRSSILGGNKDLSTSFCNLLNTNVDVMASKFLDCF
mmetsp:Transcript_4242/g.9467  ORF Transcript_4242/g.9467 Transcript_4242/m.9467 type:complete len:112 (+) Transcript_4242:1138-1473(+)